MSSSVSKPNINDVNRITYKKVLVEDNGAHPFSSLSLSPSLSDVN